MAFWLVAGGSGSGKSAVIKLIILENAGSVTTIHLISETEHYNKNFHSIIPHRFNMFDPDDTETVLKLFITKQKNDWELSLRILSKEYYDKFVADILSKENIADKSDLSKNRKRLKELYSDNEQFVMYLDWY